MTTGTDMPPALIPSDERFLSGLADTPGIVCAVGALPGYGTSDELMEAAGISASRIAAAARELPKTEGLKEGGSR